ncbi:two-component sensor histidine kinase [Nocardiopsis sp. CNR-923]|uniref:sensor histidine kinase n=1 Tax=Nocardiopsis sp. CNR-923 TaxID=1904965 RepID=UPI00095D65C1|nr:sensor histidine kinase [Nocardiopsis sp. CNR-923]OLT28111.1 two-component sensor histidine kinase [Nocardiopsis sp. CNR-923]
MAALLPRPTRTDTWTALAVLALALASTLLLEPDALVATAGAPRHAWPWGYALIVVACVPLFWRSLPTRIGTAASMAAASQYYPLGFPDGLVMLAAAVMLYSLVRHGRRVFGWVLGIGQFASMNLYELVSSGTVRLEVVGLVAWVLVLLCTAEVMRWRAEYQRADAARAAEAVRTREEELLRRASDERLRLARDVHDTVAHNISLINVQAGTALYLMESEPERAAEALATIKATSKDTLTELRAMLGVLRSADESAPRSPVRGLDRVGELVEGARRAGVDVTVVTEGRGHPPVGADMAAYRTVQEALTNVVRHSGAASATVRIRYGAATLDVEVTDDGHGTVGPPVPGNGVTGMAERAALVGGSVDVGPLAGGGFRVRARLPLNGGEPPSAALSDEAATADETESP